MRGFYILVLQHPLECMLYYFFFEPHEFLSVSVYWKLNSNIGWYFNDFNFLLLSNNAAMNIHIYVSWEPWPKVSLRYMLG